MNARHTLFLPCLVAALGALGLLGGCGLGETDDYAPLTVFDNFRVVAADQAYRSAQLDAESLRLVIKDYGIRTVINLRGENAGEAWYEAERKVTTESGVQLVDVRWSASRLPPREELLRYYDAITSAPRPVLIHCKSGADRTGAASAIWRMVIGGEAKAAASAELSALYGHFEAAYPAMDELLRRFQPSREWIATQYTP